MQPNSGGNGSIQAAELLIIIAMLESARDRHGNEWCRKHGIGNIRRKLRTDLPANVIELPAARVPEMAQYLAASQGAQSILAAHCRVCRGCKLGRE